jgi:hypothetical protein
MFALAHEHADGEDCFNASNGNYKSRLTDDVVQSPLTKKDRKRRGKLVANAEKQKGNKFKQSRKMCKIRRDHELDMSKPQFPVNHFGQGLPYLQMSDH